MDRINQIIRITSLFIFFKIDYVLMVPGMKWAFVLTADQSGNQCVRKSTNYLQRTRRAQFLFVKLLGSGHLVVSLNQPAKWSTATYLIHLMEIFEIKTFINPRALLYFMEYCTQAEYNAIQHWGLQPLILGKKTTIKQKSQLSRKL